MKWPRINVRVREPSPLQKLRTSPRFRMTQLGQGKQRLKTFLPFNRARKKSLFLQPKPKAGVDRIRFLMRQNLGFTRRRVSRVHRCEDELRLIKQINKNVGKQVFYLSALILEHLVVRRRGVHQTLPPLLLSHRRYHPYWLDCCQNKIVDLPFLWIAFQCQLLKQACLSPFVYDVLSFYLIKRQMHFTLRTFPFLQKLFHEQACWYFSFKQYLELMLLMVMKSCHPKFIKTGGHPTANFK